MSKYLLATGSITGTFIEVPYSDIPYPLYPDNDGNLWYRIPEENRIVFVRNY